jgi:cytochrome o ubiquinol oxidase operon protein cyoD
VSERDEAVDQDMGDLAPGEERGGGHGPGHGVQSYGIGLGLALLLTAASFWVASAGVIWGPAVPAALIALAVAQMGIHLAFFLHITTGPDNTNNVLALAFGVLIVLLVIGGTIWIIGHLNGNMMPMDQVMSRMR